MKIKRLKRTNSSFERQLWFGDLVGSIFSNLIASSLASWVDVGKVRHLYVLVFQWLNLGKHIGQRVLGVCVIIAELQAGPTFI